jgi:hypothetical protein
MGTTTALSGLVLPGDPAAAGSVASKDYVDRVAVDAYPCTAQGFDAWTCDPLRVEASFIGPGTGIIHGSKLWLPRAATITTVAWGIQTAGAGNSGNCMTAIYDDGATTLTRLAVSASTPANFTSVGYKTTSVGSVALAAGYYWVATIFVGSTVARYFGAGPTAPQVPQGMNGIRTFGWTAQSTLPATITRASLTMPYTLGMPWLAIF